MKPSCPDTCFVEENKEEESGFCWEAYKSLLLYILVIMALAC